jgi:predicted glutamine amidotransferase
MLAYSGGFYDTNYVLREFRILVDKGNVSRGASPGHKDGWGIICHADGTLKELGRQPTNAIADELYVTACNEAARIKPKILIAHLRKASGGSERTKHWLVHECYARDISDNGCG